MRMKAPHQQTMANVRFLHSKTSLIAPFVELGMPLSNSLSSLPKDHNTYHHAQEHPSEVW